MRDTERPTDVDDVAQRASLAADGALRLKIALAPAALATLLTFFLSRSEAVVIAVLVMTVVTVLLGVGGVSRVAAALDMDRGFTHLGRFALVFPFLDIAALAYFIVRSREAPQQEGGSAPADRARRRAARASAKVKLAARSGKAPAEAVSASASASALAPSASRSSKSSRSASATAHAVPVAAPVAAQLAAPAAAATPARQPLEYVAAAMPAVRMVGLPPDVDPDGMHVKLVDGVGRLPAGTELPADSQPAIWVTPDGFGVVYLVDDGDVWRYLTRSEVRKSGMTVAELHPRAVRNLKALAEGNQPGLKLARQDGYQGLLLGGQFESSLLLLDDLWDSTLKAGLPNGPAVAVPARDICAYCDAGSASAVARLREMAERIHATGSHPLTATVYVRRKGRWIDQRSAAPSADAGDLPPLDFTT